MSPPQQPQAAPPPATASSLAGSAYRMLVTTGAAHARQVGELGGEVARFVMLGNDTRLPEVIEALQAGVESLQLGATETRTGWLARASGRDRDTRDALAAQCRQFESEREQVEAEAREVLGRWDAHAGAARRMLVEFVVEAQALERSLVSVAKLLRDAKRGMRKERALAETGVEHLELEALAERIEALHARLRQYEGLTRTAHQTHQVAQEIAASRAALAKVLQDDLARNAARFHERLQRLLAAPPSAGGAAGGDARELAEEGRKNLQIWLAQTASTCIRLQHQEHQAAHTIAKLRERAAAVLRTGRS